VWFVLRNLKTSISKTVLGRFGRDYIDVKKSWVLYDVANSAFVLLVTSVVPIYFHQIAENGGLSESDYLSYWSAAISIVTLLLLFVGPLSGALSDKKGWRKPILMILVAIGAITCFILGFVEMWLLFLVILSIGKIVYNASLVVYDGMLIDVAENEEMDMLSAKGYSWGYIGSCIPFAMCLVVVVMSDFVDFMDDPILTAKEAMIISLVITGVWWVLMSTPLFKNYEQRYYRGFKFSNSSEELVKIKGTLRNILENKAMLFFMIAFFFYIDGVNTIIEIAIAFGETLDLGSVGLLAAMLLMQLVAFPCTILMGKLADRYGTHRIIILSICGYVCISVYAMFIVNITQFYILAVAVGFFQGTIQALSRSYFGRMVPKDRTGEYFGILDIFGKGSTIIGTGVIAILSSLIDDSYIVPKVLLALFGIGLLFFLLSTRHHVYDVSPSK